MRVEYITALLLLIIAALFMIFEVDAANNRSEAVAASGKIYNIRYDEQGQATYNEIDVDLPETNSKEEHAQALLMALFDKKHSPNFAPPGTQILTLIINDSHLIVNLSKDILGFGETYYEDCLRKQVVKTVLTIPEIDTVTVLVNNSNYYRFEKGGESTPHQTDKLASCTIQSC